MTIASSSYYYLTSDLGAGKQMQLASSPAGPASNTVTQFDDIRHHELDDINLIGSGQEWYGEHFDIVTDQTFTLDGPGILLTEKVKVQDKCGSPRIKYHRFPGLCQSGKYRKFADGRNQPFFRNPAICTASR